MVDGIANDVFMTLINLFDMQSGHVYYSFIEIDSFVGKIGRVLDGNVDFRQMSLYRSVAVVHFEIGKDVQGRRIRIGYTFHDVRVSNELLQSRSRKNDRRIVVATNVNRHRPNICPCAAIVEKTNRHRTRIDDAAFVLITKLNQRCDIPGFRDRKHAGDPISIVKSDVKY